MRGGATIDPVRALKLSTDIAGFRMAFVEAGDGPPIVLLHGNPVSSYVWRRVVPHLRDLGRVIAPDLIGMGDSARLPPGDARRYDLPAQRRFLDALLSHLEVREHVILAGHGWGAALAFDWANRHRDAVAGLAYCDTVVRPLGWADLPEETRALLWQLRSDDGEDLVLRQNILLEEVLPAALGEAATRAVLREYRRCFRRRGEDRRAMLSWVRQVPLEGAPGAACEIVAAYSEWLASNPVPKLFVDVERPCLLTGAVRTECRRWPNQREVHLDCGHFAPEERPDELGEALAAWVRSVRGA